VKWFKHDANAAIDSKLQRIKLKYGMEGYGLYWYLLECIARTVESHNLTFELEEDAELISAATGIHHERCEEMMRYMVSIKLFELSQGRIFCLKMADRTDEYTQKLIRNAQQLPSLPEAPDSVPTKSRQCPDKVPPNRTEQNRTEQKRIDKKVCRFTPPNYEQVDAYCQERKNIIDSEKFVDFYTSKNWMVGKTKMKDWKACVRTWEKSEHIANAVKKDPMMEKIRQLNGGKDEMANESYNGRTLSITDGPHTVLPKR